MFARIWRECIGVEIETPWPRMTYAEADRALRHGQAGPALRARDRGRDRAHARLRVRRLRGRARRCASSRAAGVLARRARPARGGRRRSGGRRGSRTSSCDEDGEVRSPIAKFLSEDELAALAAQPGDDAALRRRRAGPRRRACSAALRLHARPRARPDRRERVHVPLGDRLPDVRVGRGRAALVGAVHHPFTRPTDEWKERFADDPAQALAHAYDIIVNGNELGGGSFRIHEPEIQAKVFDLLRLEPGGAAGRSSASCSTRWRWARRRTAGSRSASTG